MYDSCALSALKLMTVLFPMFTSLCSSEVVLSNPSIYLHNFLLALLMSAKKQGNNRNSLETNPVSAW